MLLDDLHNLWGYVLSGPQGVIYQQTRGAYSRNDVDVASRQQEVALGHVQAAIAHVTQQKYEVIRVCQSGSHANETMTTIVSQFGKHPVAVGNFLYLTSEEFGDVLSASAASDRLTIHDPSSQLQLVPLPDTASGGVRSMKKARNGLFVVDLPWDCDGLAANMPCDAKARHKVQLKRAEQNALRRVQCLCDTHGVRALVIELLHWAWGFSLRPEFVQNLHRVLHKHGAILCVDEVLTCGRTPSFLMSQGIGACTPHPLI